MEETQRLWGEAKAEIAEIWIRVAVATNKALALAIAVLVHKGLDAGAEWVVPHDWGIALKLLKGIFLVGFAAVYLHFVWDFVATFVPMLGSKREEGHR